MINKLLKLIFFERILRIYFVLKACSLNNYLFMMQRYEKYRYDVLRRC